MKPKPSKSERNCENLIEIHEIHHARNSWNSNSQIHVNFNFLSGYVPEDGTREYMLYQCLEGVTVLTICFILFSLSDTKFSIFVFQRRYFFIFDKIAHPNHDFASICLIFHQNLFDFFSRWPKYKMSESIVEDSMWIGPILLGSGVEEKFNLTNKMTKIAS